MSGIVSQIKATTPDGQQNLKPQRNKAALSNSNIFENTCTNDNNPCVVVIDNFKDRMTNELNMPHGEAVTAFIKTALPEAGIIAYDVSKENTDGYMNTKKIISSLEDIFEKIEAGQRIDGINMSIGAEEDMSIADDLAKNRKSYKAALDPTYKKEVNLIEKIVKKGVPVFMSAGNTPGKYNPFNLAEGATNVGGIDSFPYENFEVRKGSHNSLVNAYEQYTFPVNVVSSDEETNKTCFDFTQDEKADVCMTYSENAEASFLDGTSYATPSALGKYVRQKMHQ